VKEEGEDSECQATTHANLHVHQSIGCAHRAMCFAYNIPVREVILETLHAVLGLFNSDSGAVMSPLRARQTHVWMGDKQGLDLMLPIPQTWRFTSLQTQEDTLNCCSGLAEWCA